MPLRRKAADPPVVMISGETDSISAAEVSLTRRSATVLESAQEAFCDVMYAAVIVIWVPVALKVMPAGGAAGFTLAMM